MSPPDEAPLEVRDLHDWASDEAPLEVRPADPGYPGAYPLPPPTWAIGDDIPDNATWAAQNRRINNLLMRGLEG